MGVKLIRDENASVESRDGNYVVRDKDGDTWLMKYSGGIRVEGICFNSEINSYKKPDEWFACKDSDLDEYKPYTVVNDRIIISND